MTEQHQHEYPFKIGDLTDILGKLAENTAAIPRLASDVRVLKEQGATNVRQIEDNRRDVATLKEHEAARAARWGHVGKWIGGVLAAVLLALILAQMGLH